MDELSSSTPPSSAPSSTRLPEDRLDSWKEIAAYLNRDVTTVQRWEKREGMPVHRHLHDRIGSVYASKAELDAWTASRNPRVVEGASPAEPPGFPEPLAVSAASSPRTRWKFALPLAGLGVLLAIAALFWLQKKDYFRHIPKTGASVQATTSSGGVRQAAVGTPSHIEPHSIVLADFANSTGNPIFDDTLKQALAIALRQSPFLKVLSDQRVVATLQLMTRPPSTPVTAEVSAEVCQRTGSEAYIAGSVARIGNEYVVGLKAVNCHSGETLALEQVHAEGKEKVLDALGDAAAKLRGQLGESLSSVQKFDTPIAQATTSSLEALKTYSFGAKIWNEKGEAAAMPFFKRAVELDPKFAMAYDRLAVVYGILNENAKSAEYIEKAFQLSSRTTEREKYDIASMYYIGATGEIEKANQENQLWAQSYPRDAEPHVNLGFGYSVFGQYEKADAETLEGLRLDPDNSTGYTNLIQGYGFENRLREANATYQEAIKHTPDYAGPHEYMYGIAFIEHDEEEMQRQAKWGEGRPGVADLLLSFESDTEAFHGRLGKARELSQRAAEAAHQNNQNETAGQWLMNSALREAEFGNAARAQEQSASALALASTGGVQSFAALALARAGDSVRAQKLADQLQKQYPLDTMINGYWLPTTRAAIEINRNHPSKAIESLKTAAPFEIGDQGELEFGALLYPVYVRGQAYLMLHQGAEAEAEFRKLTDHPTMLANNPLFVLAHLGLARAYALQNEPDKSRAAYQKFFDLWKDADQDIPVMKQAKAEYANLRLLTSR